MIFYFVHGAEGDRATSPSSTSRNGSIDASRLSLEAQMEHDFVQLAGKSGHFTHGKNSLLAILSFVRGKQGDETTSPSFEAENEAIDASSSLLEVLISTLQMQRTCERQHFTHGKQNTCLPIFNCLQVKRATSQRPPLLYLKTQQLRLPARR